MWKKKWVGWMLLTSGRLSDGGYCDQLECLSTSDIYSQDWVGGVGGDYNLYIQGWSLYPFSVCTVLS